MSPSAPPSRHQLQLLLLDLLSPVRPVRQAQIDALTDADWTLMQTMTGQHRLGPILHWQLDRAHCGLKLPGAVRDAFTQQFKASTLRSLQLQRELLLTHRILQSAGIPHIALKGAYLAWHSYPHPALRPLRDLDILVPAHQALQAYQQLQDGGLSRIERYKGLPEAVLGQAQHLPPLRSPSGTVNVELHSHLFHRHEDEPAGPDLSESPEFWQRAIDAPLAGSPLQFESPTDLLLHLIVHAAYDHEFNNGPLLLSDLAFLLNTHPIDWSLFWAMAECGGHTRGCWLSLKLTERYWGEKPITWPTNLAVTAVENDAPLNRAAQLMLRDFEAKDDVALHATMNAKLTLVAKAAHVLNRFFVPKIVLAAQYGARPDDWRIYGDYPVRWWQLLTQRLPGLWRTRQSDSLQVEAQQIRGLRQWLRQERHSDLTDAST